MRKEAKANADADKRRLEMVEAKNKADQLVYQTEKQVKELGDKLPADAKGKIDAAVERLKAVKDSDNLEEIKSATTQLEQVWNEAAQNIYAQPGQTRNKHKPLPCGMAGEFNNGRSLHHENNNNSQHPRRSAAAVPHYLKDLFLASSASYGIKCTR